ncbi:hypothetical protein [Micromonospora sp. WMMD998]|uniref:hypothetical protein n=1 Tax=Micromonospora sp. WMMD998 TaxID=3016092 RepID=UPI00249B93BA|nr:hypothetical protein [Micromonospora sp. WMMD998]
MADRDLPLRQESPKSPTTEHLTSLGLIREVLSKSDMLVRAMALTLFIACLVGTLFAFVSGTFWGFALFFPASITVLVWAAMRDRREKRQISGRAGADRWR